MRRATKRVVGAALGCAMDVLFLSPAYPPEMQGYVRGLSEVGARVWGVGDTPLQAMSPELRGRLAGYVQVPRILDAEDVRRRVSEWLGDRRPDRVEALWEVLVETAALLRASLDVPGMSVDTVLGFRDKQVMKQRIAAAGLRVPKAHRVRSVQEVRAAAADVGFPLIFKPISGAGSADTYRVDSVERLDAVIQNTRHVREASVEEFVEGREFTYDTLCIDGQPVFENVAWYRPRPLIARQHEWISPVIVTVRHLDQPEIAPGIALGRGVLKALNMGTGFTHMEWYLTDQGEVVFGEIGCRPGGAHLIDQMNLTCDVDLFREWARAVCWKDFRGSTTRTYNVAIIFKRAKGEGRIRAVHGVDAFCEKYRQWVVADRLLPVGAHRRDWTKTLVSDGFLLLRHPDLATANAMADEAASTITMFAGG